MVVLHVPALGLAAALMLSPVSGAPHTTPAQWPDGHVNPQMAARHDPARPGAVRRWRPPTTPLRVRAPYDPPPQPWLAGHRGIDLRVGTGQDVLAAGSGRVAFVGVVAGRPVLSIDHGELRTTYEPVLSALKVGDLVAVGDAVGTVGTGSGHCGSGRCLHFGLRRGTQYLDPLLLIGRTIALLRPW